MGGDFETLLRENTGTTAKSLHLSQFSLISASDFHFVSVPPKQQRSLVLYGVEMAQAANHLGKLHGQLPATATAINEFDVLISASTAKALELKVGDNVPLQFAFYRQALASDFSNIPEKGYQTITAHISGILDGNTKQTDYWHNSDFDPFVGMFDDKVTTLISSTMLIPNESLLFLSDQLTKQNKNAPIFSTGSGFKQRWYYRLDLLHISIANLASMSSDIDNLLSTYQAYYGDIDGASLGSQSSSSSSTFPYLKGTDLTSSLFNRSQTASVLYLFQQRVDVSGIPVAVLAIQIILLILFFVSLMTNLLMDRQREALLLLRSRGASSGQIFGMLLIQCLVSGLVAFVIGAPLAIGVVMLLARQSPTVESQSALNIVTDHLSQVVQTNMLYGLGILLVMLLTMSIQLIFVVRSNVLVLRQQTARGNARPL